MLPKTSAYAKSYDGEIKWVCFFIEDDKLLEIYITVFGKESTIVLKKT